MRGKRFVFILLSLFLYSFSALAKPVILWNIRAENTMHTLRLIYYLLRQQKYSVEGARQYLKDNQKKAAMQVQLVESLTKFRSFLLELRTNLGA